MLGRWSRDGTTETRGAFRPVRRQLICSDARQLCLHDHVAWCGDGVETLADLAASAFSGAAERGESMLLVSDHVEDLQRSGWAGFTELVRSGALTISTVADAYGALCEPATQRAAFEEVLTRALGEGYSGLCVVADNSALARGSEEDFAAWLAWEAMADDLQAHLPITGICYFDRSQVTGDRLEHLATLHPVLCREMGAPRFSLFVDGDAVRVLGVLDTFGTDQLRRILMSASRLSEFPLDVSATDFIDHRALLTLEQVARAGRPVRLRGASAVVHKLWALLGVAEPALQLG